ncbi:unnamed protein product [Oreochromis niloticus]|nr:unnamed protein product [Mustela putorius furo]
MSAASNLRAEDQFLCSICLEVFANPVTTPCGHNFCKRCITQHWDVNMPSQCPMCKETFNTRPQLKVNTLLSGVVSQFKREAQKKVSSSSSSEQQAAKPQLPCNVFTGARPKALKSCRETRLEPRQHLYRELQRECELARELEEERRQDLLLELEQESELARERQQDLWSEVERECELARERQQDLWSEVERECELARELEEERRQDLLLELERESELARERQQDLWSELEM